MKSSVSKNMSDKVGATH